MPNRASMWVKMLIVSTDCSGEKQEISADLENIEQHRALECEAP